MKSCLLFQTSVIKDISLPQKNVENVIASNPLLFILEGQVQKPALEERPLLVRSQTDLILPETFGCLSPVCGTGAPFCTSRNYEQSLDTLHDRMEAKASRPWLGYPSLHTAACEPQIPLSCGPAGDAAG